jgi:hypothetical protein
MLKHKQFGHNFERHHNNLSSVNYLMTTIKIERAFIHPFVYNTHDIKNNCTDFPDLGHRVTITGS